MSKQQKQQVIVKKKKKKLRTGYDQLEVYQILLTKQEIAIKLKKIMSRHIGRENSIEPYELFAEITGANPESVNIYVLSFWWDIIKKVIRELRGLGEIFIILERSKVFVLQTQEEANKFKGFLDRDIRGLTNAKERADDWVREEKWKKLT